MLLFSSHYPWYYLWLLPFVCLIPYVPMLYFSTACFYLYTTSLANQGPAMYYMFEWLYATIWLCWHCGGRCGRRSVGSKIARRAIRPPQSVCHLCEELMSESLSVLPRQEHAALL